MYRHALWLALGLVVCLCLALATGCSDSGTMMTSPDLAGADGPSAPDLASTDGPPPTVAPGPSHGSPIALATDDSLAVVCNRDVGSVTVLALHYPSTGAPTATTVAELQVGAEPWQAVVSPDGTRAFVVLRRDQKLVAIDNLKTNPQLGASANVGSEPTGVALTPTGGRVWVSSWIDGTLSEVDPSTMTVSRTVDLNAALASSGILGTSVTARPALAHPRSLAITNNGDTNDNDESIYVTEYYGQRSVAESADGSNADVSKQGVVYRVKLADLSVSTITLAPLADVGFKDHLGQTAGCFPNQLQAIALNDKYAYVTSICASPRGPTGPFTKTFKSPCANPATDCLAPAGVTAACVNNACTTNCAADSDCEPNGGKCNLTTGVCAANPADVKTTIAPLVSVIDTTTNAEVPAATASLNAQFNALYTTAATPDDGTRRFPLFPVDMAFVAGSGVGYVAANGADAVFRVKYDLTTGAIAQVGASTGNFINLNPAGITPATAAGKNPIGLAITFNLHGGKLFAITANDVSRNVSIIDLDAQGVAGGPSAPAAFATTALPTPGSKEDHALTGKRFFNTGVGRWSLKGQAWNACQSCHGDGLSDNVTWYFNRGPRQSTSLDGTFSKKDPTDQRVLNWTGIFDELADFENNTRGISGGVGAIVTTNSTPPAITDRMDITQPPPGNSGLNGSAAQAADPTNPQGLAQPGLLTDWQNITAYVQTVRSPRAPTNLDAAQVAAGRTLFEGATCQGCHGGDKWTISHVFYSPSPANNTALKSKAWTVPAGFPSALVPAATATNRFMRFGGANPAAFDQIQCVLRPVGTFAAAEQDVATAGVFPELRVDMTTKAQGSETDGNGFNPPSLLGGSVGAPFLHTGGVRTLEGLFASSFATHYQALAPNFLTDAEPARSQKVAQLVQFLLSIDGDSTAESIPAAGSSGGDFCVFP
jgi:hypothetical protein